MARRDDPPDESTAGPTPAVSVAVREPSARPGEVSAPEMSRGLAANKKAAAGPPRGDAGTCRGATQLRLVCVESLILLSL